MTQSMLILPVLILIVIHWFVVYEFHFFIDRTNQLKTDDGLARNEMDEKWNLDYFFFFI